MRILAPAKINLTLDVHNRREDGYHNLTTVIQTLRFGDWLDIELTDNSGRIDLEVVYGDGADPVPSDASNLAVRAAKAMVDAAKSDRGVRIRLEKNIPSEAGLGGGSSNAAATLIAINTLLGSPLSRAELAAIGSKLGSDVPFFLTGGTCLAEGIGERVTPLADIEERRVLVVKPPTGVSTTTAYTLLDARREFDAIPGKRTWDGRTLRNDFENVALDLCPAIRWVKQALTEIGCEQALVCGSGSAVYGFISEATVGQSEIDKMAADLAARDLGRVILTSTLSRAEIAAT
jgi:4-diphosphocytidyl-2-C-methyl-D-erythritol kinase